MKSIRRVVAILLVVTLLGCYMSYLGASAVQSCSDRFVKTYKCIGNGAKDIAGIAMENYGRFGSQFGYIGSWGTDFVSDCAALAGQSAAIMTATSALEMRNSVLNNGGQTVYADYHVGDLVFINWNGGDTVGSVEIICNVSPSGSITTIGGDLGNATSHEDKYVMKHIDLSKKYIVSVVRPAYDGKPVVVSTKEYFGEDETNPTTQPTYIVPSDDPEGDAVQSTVMIIMVSVLRSILERFVERFGDFMWGSMVNENEDAIIALVQGLIEKLASLDV